MDDLKWCARVKDLARKIQDEIPNAFDGKWGYAEFGEWRRDDAQQAVSCIEIKVDDILSAVDRLMDLALDR